MENKNENNFMLGVFTLGVLIGGIFTIIVAKLILK
jgi:hypothetical protein